MIARTEDLVASLLDMPQRDVQNFIRKSVRSREFGFVVRQLNSEVLSKSNPNADAAARALRKLGFAD